MSTQRGTVNTVWVSHGHMMEGRALQLSSSKGLCNIERAHDQGFLRNCGPNTFPKPWTAISCLSLPKNIMECLILKDRWEQNVSLHFKLIDVFTVNCKWINIPHRGLSDWKTELINCHSVKLPQYHPLARFLLWEGKDTNLEQWSREMQTEMKMVFVICLQNRLLKEDQKFTLNRERMTSTGWENLALWTTGNVLP